ncbi:MAG TPA: thioredoxin family protein [Anaerolineaceae bacterium]
MDSQLFAQGLTPAEYIAAMGENRARFEAHLAESEPEAAQSARLPASLQVMVIAEPWSGDVLYYLPPILALARKAGWQVRIFHRDEHPELIEPYRKDGLYRSIPVVVFYDANFREVAAWIERPAKATAVIDEESLKLRRRLREEHKAEWRAETLREVTDLVNSKAS